MSFQLLIVRNQDARDYGRDDDVPVVTNPECLTPSYARHEWHQKFVF